MTPKSEKQISILCFGVGAIGTYIGGSLAASGHRVVFVERPAVADIVRKQGISIDINGARLRVVDPKLEDSIEKALTLGPFDAAILAVKSFDTQSVLDGLKAYAADLPPIISFQNGVENEPLISSTLGANKVIAGTVTTAVGRNGPGDIIVERLRGVGIATNNIYGKEIIKYLNQAGLRAHGYANPAAMKWSKLLTNLIANATSAILNMTPAEIFSHPGLFEIEIRQLLETLKVMTSLNIPVVDLPSTPVRLLAWISANLPHSISRILLSRSVGKGRGGKMPSFHIDLYSNRGKSEVDYLNGAVVRAGKLKNIATPVNMKLNEILIGMTIGEISRDTYSRQPDKLINEIPPE